MPTFVMKCTHSDGDTPSCTAEPKDHWGKYDDVMAIPCEVCGAAQRQMIAGTGGYIWKARGYGGPNEGVIDRNSIEFGTVKPNSDGYMRFGKV